MPCIKATGILRLRCASGRICKTPAGHKVKINWGGSFDVGLPPYSARCGAVRILSESTRHQARAAATERGVRCQDFSSTYTPPTNVSALAIKAVSPFNY